MHGLFDVRVAMLLGGQGWGAVECLNGRWDRQVLFLYKATYWMSDGMPGWIADTPADCSPTVAGWNKNNGR